MTEFETNEEPVPGWADRWLGGHCACGARAVEVKVQSGGTRVACSVSAWNIEGCPIADALGVEP